MNDEKLPRELILDTSVAVKFHVPEEEYEKARQMQRAFSGLGSFATE